MIVHPELRALRRDDSPQCEAQELLHQAIVAWREQPGVAPILKDLERLAAGTAIDAIPSLAALFTEGTGAAKRLTDSFVAAYCAAMSLAPLGHLSLRHYSDGLTSTLLIAQTGSVTLSLVAIDGERMGERPLSTAVSFTHNLTWEYVLAGRADVELVKCRPNGPDQVALLRRKLAIGPGTIMHRDGQHDARLLGHIDGVLVSLRLQSRRANAGPSREYDLGSGMLLHQAAGNPRDSRIELMLAILGRMGRADAAPHMASLALGQASAALRWQALRECLALDTSAGFAALSEIAGSPDDALSASAAGLRAQLIKTYPQLQELELCPA